MNDELSPEERALLGHWTPTEPTYDFVDRVVVRATRRRWPRWAAVAAAVLLLLGARFLHWPSEGTRTVAERTTLALGDRGTVVAEAGAEWSWRVDWDGEARIEQRAGDIFYRVERGGPFWVTTPAGSVEVTGTSFRVEVDPMGNKKVGALSAGAGALVASLAWVTVYEGSVVTASPQGTLKVAAGEGAALATGEAPKARASAGAAIALVPEGQVWLAPAGADGSAAGEARVETVESLRADKARLAAQVEALQAQVAAVPAKAEAKEGTKTFDLSPEELSAMADKCELRWDTIPIGPEAPSFSPEKAEKAEISEEERAVVNRVLAAEHQRLIRSIQENYRALTGDDSGSLSTYAMLSELDDKVPEEALKQIFQRLSAERAGRVPPPTPDELSAATPSERAYRLMTQSGDVTERAIAKELGPEVAARLRRQDDGWSSRHRSSYGCP